MELKSVSYSYDRKQNQLKQVSGSIKRGTITTIIGPNGSGKSTLLGVLAQSYEPQSGEVTLDGRLLSTYKSKELARKIAVVHQQNTAPQDMTVEKLTAYGRLPYQSMFSSAKAEDKRIVEWALEKTNLLDKRSKPISDLSGGERQRVWIAMTLAQNTPYLFLDEPTSFLDIYYQYEILELVKELNVTHGLTIVMVLHDINQAVKYSDELLVMKDGRLVTSGDPRKIMTEELIKDVYGVNVVISEVQDEFMIIPTGI